MKIPSPLFSFLQNSLSLSPFPPLRFLNHQPCVEWYTPYLRYRRPSHTIGGGGSCPRYGYPTLLITKKILFCGHTDILGAKNENTSFQFESKSFLKATGKEFILKEK